MLLQVTAFLSVHFCIHFPVTRCLILKDFGHNDSVIYGEISVFPSTSGNLQNMEGNSTESHVYKVLVDVPENHRLLATHAG